MSWQQQGISCFNTASKQLKVCISIDNAKEAAKVMICFHEQSWYIIQVTNESSESTGVHYGQQKYEYIQDEDKKAG